MSHEYDDLTAWLTKESAGWKRLIEAGHVGLVLQAIDRLPPEFEIEKPSLRIQMLHLAGLYGEALEGIKTLSLGENPDPLALIKLIRIALDGGGHEVAAELLARLIPLLRSQHELEEAVIVADGVGDQQLQDVLVEGLRTLFPQSAVLARMNARNAAARRDYLGAATALASLGDSEALRQLYLAFSKYGEDTDIDYSVLADANKTSSYWDNVGARLLVKEATLRHELRRVIPIIESTVSDDSRRTNLLLEILAASFIEAGDKRLDENEQLTLVWEVVNHLAAHPEQKGKRIRLMRILSPEMSGTSGMALIAFVVFGLAQELKLVAGTSYLYGTGASAEFLAKHMDVVRTIFNWLDDHAPIQLGRTTFPRELLTADADELAGSLLRAIAFQGRELKTDSDVEALRKQLALIVGISPHTTKTDFDLKAMRLVGGILANAGRVQSGRDIAETALDMAGTSDRRRALAWSAMADVYIRTNSYLDSLIAIACSFAASRELDGEELWHGLDSSIRVFRDLHLFPLAKALHKHATATLEELDFWPSNKHRHELLSLQIDALEYLSSAQSQSGALEQLLERAQTMAKRVIEANDDAVPVAFVLSQLVQKAKHDGLTVDESLLASISERTGAFKDVIETVSKPAPTVGEALAFHRRLESPRFAEDVALDQRQVGIVARRLLASDDPEVLALAIELLADRSIAQPGQTATARPLAPLTDEKTPANFARSISQHLALVMAAFDPSERLVSVVASKGKLTSVKREPPDSFSEEQFQDWTKEFPYRYGVDSRTMNLFYVSTENLKVSELPEGPIVLLTEPTLQQLPPNLLRIGDSFAGLTRPMSAAPSLSWLAAARDNARLVPTQLRAWIPTERHDAATLGMLVERLSPTFDEYGVQLDTHAELPRSAARSGVVIVAAHGAVGPNAEYFSHLSDETTFKSDSMDFAQSISQVAVVILFVCSGGRLDRHPSADTTVGLARELLYRGSSTVIASPWPLDARVPYHWLPEFLRSWKGGSSIVQANFDANAIVGKQLGNDLAKSLAMTVYGDPLTKFPGKGDTQK